MGFSRILALSFCALLIFGCLGAPQQPPAPAPPQQAFVPEIPEFPQEQHAAPPPSPPEMKIHFINAGFGDSTLITTGGKALLFDAGNSESAPAVLRTLKSAGVEKIDILALSSNSSEHIGGAPQVATSYLVGSVLENGIAYSDEASSDVARVTQTATHKAVKYGDKFTLGNAEITVLNPQQQLSLGTGGVDSMALKVSYGTFCALLFSDSEGGPAVGTEMGMVMGGIDSKIASGSVPIKCQVIKVGNHGSGNAASFQLLEAAKPSLAVISVGANPGSKFPEPALLERLRLKNISILRTDQSGTIVITTDGSNYSVSTG